MRDAAPWFRRTFTRERNKRPRRIHSTAPTRNAVEPPREPRFGYDNEHAGGYRVVILRVRAGGLELCVRARLGVHESTVRIVITSGYFIFFFVLSSGLMVFRQISNRDPSPPTASAVPIGIKNLEKNNNNKTGYSMTVNMKI